MPQSRHLMTCLGSGVLLLAACDVHSPSGRRLSLGDFSDPSMKAQARPSEEEAATYLIEAGLPPLEDSWGQSSPTDANEGFFDVEAEPGRQVVVDSLIGQVNGRPIYADDVLGPIMDRLSATYEDQPYRLFQEQLTKLVIDQLQAVTINELLIAESRAKLSSEQQTGLLAFMDQLKEDTIRDRGGVQREAERRLLAEEGKTIDEYLEDERQKLLIQEVLRERVQPYAVVSWRDIERAYRSRIDEFKPSAIITLGRIRLTTAGNEDRIAMYQGELEAGEPFDVVARQAGMNDDGLWESFKLPEGGLKDLPLADFYKPHLENLKPGETSSPFERGRWTIWVSVMSVDQQEQRSLDDPEVQRLLQQQLAMTRSREAESRFIGQVLQRGIYDDMELMAQRSVAIAMSRFPPK